VREIEKHHAFPVRFFGRKNNRSIINLCADCHREIESLLPYDYKFSKGQYIEIHRQWLKGNRPMIVIKNEERKAK